MGVIALCTHISCYTRPFLSIFLIIQGASVTVLWDSWLYLSGLFSRSILSLGSFLFQHFFSSIRLLARLINVPSPSEVQQNLFGIRTSSIFSRPCQK